MLDKTIDKVIKELAVKYNKPEDYIQNIVYHQFFFIKEGMKNFYPRILIHNLGSFNTSRWKIEAYIRSTIQSKKKGNISYARAKKIVTKLWKIRKKIKEYDSRTEVQ